MEKEYSCHPFHPCECPPTKNEEPRTKHKERFSSPLSPLAKLLARLGIDQAIANVLLARGWSVISGPVSILFVARFMSPVEQGYFYTFSSLQGLQIFFELGLTFVIMQFASHEKAGLEWTERGTLEGDPRNKMRLGSLLRFSIRWYSVAAALAILVLSAAGVWFFSTSAGDAAHAVNWKIPWILVVCTTGASLVLAPLYGIIEGCGRIAEVNGVFAKQAILASIIFWICLWSGAKLYAVAVMGGIPLLIAFPWIFSKYLPLLRDLWHESRAATEKISWKKEIWPLQWKISLSWASGYFISMLANPVLFRYRGPVVAGQYGMSLKLVESIQSLAFAWTSTKAATFGTLIAKNDFSALKKLFRASAAGSLGAFGLAAAGLLAVVAVLHALQLPIAARLLSTPLLSLMCANSAINCLVFSIATLLRSEKREPLLLASVAFAILNTIGVFTFGIAYGAIGVVLPFLAINIAVVVPVACFFLKDFWRRHLRGSQP